MTEDKLMELAVTVPCMVVAIPTSFYLDKRLHNRLPNVMPYKWGYYTGVMGLLLYCMISLLFFIGAAVNSSELILPAFFFASSTVPFVFIIKRYRWAWVVGSILLFNPVSWIINFIYAKNRWNELIKDKEVTAEPDSAFVFESVHSQPKSTTAQLSQPLRIVICLSALWAISVVIFVLLFEPYGRFRDRDFFHMIKVICFPPTIAFIGYYLFTRFVTRQ